MFWKRRTLTVPDDVARLLDTYAQGLSDEFGMTVTRQQAFDRFTRLFLGPKAEVKP